MNRLEKLNQEIETLENKLEPLQEERRELWRKQEQELEDRMVKAHRLEEKFDIDELRFAATARCKCEAGLAYPKGAGAFSSWHCSAILMGIADQEKTHISGYPFSFYNIKSEDQPSAEGRTTRPE